MVDLPLVCEYPPDLPRPEWASPLTESRATRTTAIAIKGVMQHYDALLRNETEFPLQGRARLTRETVDSVLQSYELESAWMGVAKRSRRGRTLHVVVLGFSTANGCGSRDIGDGRKGIVCDPASSWGRRMSDALQARLSNSRSFGETRVRTNIYAKNAVHISFFDHCTSRMVPSDADVVVLEAGSNMFDADSGDTGLYTVVPAIRKAAPHAAISMVAWVDSTTMIDRSQPLRKLLMRDGEALHADLLDVPRLLRLLALDWKACNRSSKTLIAQWYANNGTDHHPNARGHQLIAEVVARHILQRLVNASESMPIHGHPALPEVAVGAVAVSSAPPNEVCFNSADEMRVHAVRGGWRLVDEGSAKKGVQKLGWLSTQPGDEIDFVSVPIANPNAKQAAHSPVCNTARLGYLLTTDRPQGAFHISCVGSCACSGVSRATSFWVKASRSQSGVFPFPRISTDANKYLSKFNAEHQLGRNLSVTAVTEFTMLHRGARNESSCLLRVRHERERAAMLLSTGPADPTTLSRVRLDSLSYRSASCTDTWYGDPKELLRPKE